MTPDHEEQAKAAERELADMEERAEKLGDRIDEARDDWEAKKQDSSVPGAGGDPDRAEEGGQHPETAYPAKGPDDEVTEKDPTDNDRGVEDTPDGDDPPDEDEAGGEERASGGESVAREAGANDDSEVREADEDAGAGDEQRGEGTEAG